MWMTSKLTATVSQIALTRWSHGQGQASLWFIRCCPGNHSDAVDNRADAETQSTARTSVGNAGQVGVRIKPDGLQAERKVTARRGRERPAPAAAGLAGTGARGAPRAGSYGNSWAAREKGKRETEKKSFYIRNAMFRIP